MTAERLDAAESGIERTGMSAPRWREPLDAIRVVRRSLGDAWDPLIVVGAINLIWMGLALTIVLLPAATAALFESMHGLAAGRSPGIRDYLGLVRRRFFGGWVWAAWAAAVITIVGANIGFHADPAGSPSWLSAVFVVLGALLGVSLLYVWPFVFLQPDASIVRAIRNSLLLVLAAPLFALVLAGLTVLLLAVSAVLVLPLAVAAPSLVCLIASHAVTDRLRAFGRLPALSAMDDGA